MPRGIVQSPYTEPPTSLRHRGGLASPNLPVFGLIALLMWVHMAYNLQRIAYVNELVSVAGLSVAVFSTRWRRDFWNSRVVRPYTAFMVWGGVWAVFSFFALRDTSPYLFLRTTVVVYSGFAFLIGVRLAEAPRWTRDLVRWFGIPLVLVSLFVSSDILAAPAAAAIAFSERKRPVLLTLLYLGALFVLRGRATTAAMVLVVLFYWLFRNRKSLARWLFRTGLVLLVFASFILLMLYVYDAYREFYVGGYEVIEADGFNDRNALWRLFFWAYLAENRLLQAPVAGIGFGTPLFDIRDPAALFIVHGALDRYSWQYVLGPHNSLVYVFARMGLIGLTSFLMFNMRLIQQYWTNRDQFSRSSEGLFLAFLLLMTGAAFNVVIESPIYASAYWMSAGWLYSRMTRGSPGCRAKGFSSVPNETEGS